MGHHYRQLTQEERYQISALEKLGRSRAAIARELGRSRSTIGRELERNSGGKRYDPARAQRLSDGRRREAYKANKRLPSLFEFVERRLAEDHWSPEQIAGSMRVAGHPLVSHEWIYRHVERDQAQGGELYRNLRHKRRKYRRRYGRGARSCSIPNRRDISERPEVVE
jgi:transposase, IS30 family